MRNSFNASRRSEINFEEWLCGVVDPVIKEVEALIPNNLTNDQEAIKVYWSAFAQNTINLSRVISNLPHHFNQVMMTFRLLQETSADIFYLKNHTENIAHLAKAEIEIEKMKIRGNFTLRHMSQIIADTDIRNKDTARSGKDATQARINTASLFLDENLGEGMTQNLRDINNLLNGYSHFNPAGVYLQNNLTDNGYFETYMKILSFYPAWLYLVLVSLSDLLGVEELNAVNCEKIIEDLFNKIEESSSWVVEFINKQD